MSERPLFYVDGRRVFKRPVKVRQDEGGTIFEIGFPVCQLTDYASDSAAEAIAIGLNDLFGTPTPWRRTYAQQVQDLHIEVHRWRERARAAEAEIARGAQTRARAAKLRERLADYGSEYDHISVPVNLGMLKALLGPQASDGSQPSNTPPGIGQTAPATAAPGLGSSQPGPGAEREQSHSTKVIS